MCHRLESVYANEVKPKTVTVLAAEPLYSFCLLFRGFSWSLANLISQRCSESMENLTDLLVRPWGIGADRSVAVTFPCLGSLVNDIGLASASSRLGLNRLYGASAVSPVLSGPPVAHFDG